MAINFDEWRRMDGSINLCRMWEDNVPDRLTEFQIEAGTTFLAAMEEAMHIRSRQVAVLAISTAGMLAALSKEEE